VKGSLRNASQSFGQVSMTVASGLHQCDLSDLWYVRPSNRSGTQIAVVTTV